MTQQITQRELEALEEYGMQPHSGVEVVPDRPASHIPAGAVAVEQSGSGIDTVFEYEGKRYYTPASTMHKVGFHDSEEYKRAQGVGANLGPHEGANLPEDTIVYFEGGKPIARYTRTQFVKDIANIPPEKLRYSIKAHTGREKLLTEKEYTKLSELTGKEQFNEAKKLKLIPVNSRYVGGPGESWKYETGHVRRPRKVKPPAISTTPPSLPAELIEPPKARKYRPAVAGKENKIKDIWRLLTPWDESQESYAEYMKGWPQRVKETFAGVKPKKQSVLKQEHEEYNNSPIWAKILFPSKVGYDSRTKRYYQLAYSEGPATGKQKVFEAARRTVKTLDKVDWKKVKEAVVNARIKQAVNAASKGKGSRVSGYKRETPQGIKDYKRYLEGIKRLEDKAKVLTSKEEVALGLIKAKPAQAQQFQRIILLQPTRTMQEDAAINIAMDESSAPMWNAAAKAAEYAREKQRYGTAQQQKYATQAMAAVALSNAIQIASQTRTSVQTQVQEELKFLPVSQLKTKVINQIKTIISAPSKPKVPPTTTTRRINVKSRLKAPPKIPKINTSVYQKKARETIRNSKSAIAWRQGQLHGKDRWDVVTNPYGQEQYFIIMGRRPMGARVISGPGSAYKTAQIVGDVPHDLRRPALIDQAGMFSTKLSPLGESSRDLRITFTRDIDIGGKGKVFPLPKR